MEYKTHAPLYRTKILRMWTEQHSNRMRQWRFSLEDVATRERNGFADLDALIHHLLALMDAEQTSGPGDGVFTLSRSGRKAPSTHLPTDLPVYLSTYIREEPKQ